MERTNHSTVFSVAPLRREAMWLSLFTNTPRRQIIAQQTAALEYIGLGAMINARLTHLSIASSVRHANSADAYVIIYQW